MKNRIFLVAAFIALPNVVCAEPVVTHCTDNEQTLFSCILKKHKTVSICASKDMSPTSGYMQYRFGKLGKVEITIPKSQKGFPEITLQASKDSHAEYNSLNISNGPFNYSLESFRQLTPKNKDGYPTPASSDSLRVEDSRKSMREGNIAFSDDCASLVSPVDAATISRLTGKNIEKAGF